VTAMRPLFGLSQRLANLALMAWSDAFDPIFVVTSTEVHVGTRYAQIVRDAIGDSGLRVLIVDEGGEGGSTIRGVADPTNFASDEIDTLVTQGALAGHIDFDRVFTLAGPHSGVAVTVDEVDAAAVIAQFARDLPDRLAGQLLLLQPKQEK
jgi:hypothetical protein